jgi:hypothetical protein
MKPGFAATTQKPNSSPLQPEESTASQVKHEEHVDVF